MEKLEERLGYRFQRKDLLTHALTHSSYANEHRGLTSNERLEFLGDSVLGMVTAEYLYQTHPDMPEGELTRTRAALVCEASLHQVAMVLHLGDYLLLGRGESTSGGRTRPSILADATEAVLAAVYLDGGMDAVKPIIRSLVLNREKKNASERDYKTALQELVQKYPGNSVSYQLVEESGPDHDRSFVTQVSVNQQPVGRGHGRTKKEAEQKAAQAALEYLTSGKAPKD